MLRFQRVKITEIRRVWKSSYFVWDSTKDYNSLFLTKGKTNYKGRNQKIKKNIILVDILLFSKLCLLLKFSLNTSIPNLVSLTHSIPQIFDKFQTGIFSISRFLVKCLMNKNFRYSETINCIVMLFGPLSKFETRNMMT